MKEKRELKELSKSLSLILKILERYGLEIRMEEFANMPGTNRIKIYPIFMCENCKRISANRTFCLWCEE